MVKKSKMIFLPPLGLIMNKVNRTDYKPSNFNITSVEIVFDIRGLDDVIVSSYMTMVRNGVHEVPLVLDGDGIDADEVLIDNKSASFSIENESKLVIAEVPDNFTIHITTHLNPLANKSLAGLYASNGRLFTQCEAEGFRKITWFIDRPDIMPTWTVIAVADPDLFPVTISNGNIALEHYGSGKRIITYKDPFPKPCYLFALVAGNLSSLSKEYVANSGKDSKLIFWSEPENIDKCQFAMDSLVNAIDWDSKKYGLDLDLDVYHVVSVSDFNMGAMENKGLNIFNTKYILADKDSATDDDYENVEAVIGHEYFHNWTGNRVTCRDWFQLSLKEGLTVFRDQEFSSDMRVRSIQRIKNVNTLRNVQFSEDAGPLSHPIRPSQYAKIDNFYTSTVYNKGSEVVRMINTIIGDTTFAKGLKLYLARNDGTAATCEDFVLAMGDASGYDFSTFFRWYSTSGTPKISVSEIFEDGVFKINIKQMLLNAAVTQENCLSIPIRISLFDASGVLLKNDLLILENPEQSWEYGDLNSRPILSVLEDFSAPVSVEYLQQSEQDLEIIACFAVDPFARWDAVQKIASNRIKSIMNNEVVSESMDKIWKTIIDDKSINEHFKAMLLTLPSINWIGEQLKVHDPIEIMNARNKLFNYLAVKYMPEFECLYKISCSVVDGLPYEPCGDQQGLRALLKVSLMYLAEAEESKWCTVASEILGKSDNLTNSLTALNIISRYQTRHMGEFSTWGGSVIENKLVWNQWLTLHIARPWANGVVLFDDVWKCSWFDRTNPNTVMAAVGGLVANTASWHRSDGTGYKAIAEKIIEVDQRNPQLAARMTKLFAKWRRLSQPYSENMKKVLEDLSSCNLSDMTKEIVALLLK